MEKLTWNSQYIVGVPVLDRQHESIFGLINQLIEAAERGLRADEVSDGLTRLTTYAREHFKEEEAMLAAAGYDDLEAHLAEHRAYRIRVVELCGSAARHEFALPEELLAFLRDWWSEHVLVAEMAFAPLLSEQPRP